MKGVEGKRGKNSTWRLGREKGRGAGDVERGRE